MQVAIVVKFVSAKPRPGISVTFQSKVLLVKPVDPFQLFWVSFLLPLASKDHFLQVFLSGAGVMGFAFFPAKIGQQGEIRVESALFWVMESKQNPKEVHPSLCLC